MANLSGVESISFFLDETLFEVSIPARFRYMQELWIQTRITQRLGTTGAIRKDFPYPRQWTGYYYLFSENCIFKSGAIEYQNQEIYRQQNFSWNTEVAVNENAFNLSTPEVPPDVDNIDEAAESDLWLSTSDLENIYLPVQLPIDKVGFHIPVGCELEVLVCGRKFSPISAFGGENDIDLYEDANNDGIPDLLIPTPENPLAFSEMDVNDILTTFDDIAIARGYIPPSGLDSAARASGYIPSSECPAQQFQFKYIISLQYRVDGAIIGTLHWAVLSVGVPSVSSEGISSIAAGTYPRLTFQSGAGNCSSAISSMGSVGVLAASQKAGISIGVMGANGVPQTFSSFIYAHNPKTTSFDFPPSIVQCP